MNDESAAIALGRRIDLTREADFSLGGVEIRPAACEALASGRRVPLEPQVMKLLVALARARGEPMSREALIAVCWGPVSVGDDAVNRCVQRLRRLAEAEAASAFEIETIPKMGYRLVTSQPAGRPAGPGTGAAASRSGRRRGWLVSAAGLATAATVAATLIWSPRPARWSVERSERLVSTPLRELHPAISPDGTMLAYSAGPDVASRHIYLKRLAGGDSIQLTDDPFDDAAPAWSPDGARIVYVAYRAGEPCRIMVAAVPAGPARQLARCQGAERSRAAWSERGDALFFADSATLTAPERIVRLDLATGRREAVSDPPGGLQDHEPAISPDGRWLFFLRDSGETSARLVIHDLNTGRERLVADIELRSGGAAWADDSKSLFVAGANGNESTLWSYPIAGGSRGLVAHLPLEIGRLASGPNDLLAAEINAGRFNAVRSPSPAGSAPVVVDPADGATWSPAYSPDGTLALASDRSGDPAIWVMRPGSRARLFLNLKGGYSLDLSWSPDGASLAFVAAGGGTIAVRVVGPAGEARARIPVPGVEAGRPAWSADARSLVFPVRDGGGWRLWRADLARPARPWPITGYGWVTVRAAGDTLYAVRSDRPGIWRLGPPSRLIAAGFSGRSREAWTIYKNEVVFADAGDAGRRRLLSAPLSGGPARLFAAIPGATYDPDFAIDPQSGKPTYITVINADFDIELFHLARR
jgi:Tol biopolymer transport system component/DNA-binding winged helix-turn-helix (wHTH) protein